ncbi:hypothetical protein BN971_01667 [Mycobacterium bohemicum DSM 44277]|uniref:Uncharacterized protein n=2 Tax=Mycobacterium bohemicum TaxID=56425 RepID=A0A1X1QXC8_MYCBE|nr:hypothetical protein [Mycobacterium bohemicum]MCV6970513.1 hypothetical protein [Mycobacterium bohemicum]ORU95961.1 hypothetical protein AWB93_23690 [Mycobacterium bohemicum]CPR09928.1 hypothetical protein BN971_01667 [Mycobacterium bohemicum DSM 44277]
MTDQHETRQDKITVPRRMPEGHVHALAMQKAQRKVRRGNRVADLQLGESKPVGGGDGTDVEWSFRYQVVPPPGG